MPGVLSELAGVGFEVDSISELRESGRRYSAAVPVLVRWLSRVTTPAEKQEIVRALSVPWARGEALPALLLEFAAVRESADPAWASARWAIGNAIEVLWDDAYFDELVALARDSRYGRAREMVVLGLGKSKRSEVGSVLVELLDDATVNGHAVSALKRRPELAARPGLERMMGDRRAWVRRDAKAALVKLDRLG